MEKQELSSLQWICKGIGNTQVSILSMCRSNRLPDANYKGKAEYALRALKDHDFVVVHVEAPDEAGHVGI